MQMQQQELRHRPREPGNDDDQNDPEASEPVHTMIDFQMLKQLILQFACPSCLEVGTIAVEETF